MMYVGFVVVDAEEITRGGWWEHANVPTYNRKGNPDDPGFMWCDKDGYYCWSYKDTFEQQFKKCL